MKPIILDLCGGSGSWSKPYQDAGYDVRIITLPEHDVRDYHWTGGQVFGVLAAPPCESFSNARRGHPVYNQSMCRKDGLDIVRACMRIIKECNPVWWALENPATGDLVKYLGKPDMTFQPYEFGDGWAKKTALWGKFNHPKKIYTAKNRPVALPGLYVRPGRDYPSLAFQHKNHIACIPQFAPFADFVKTDYDLRSIKRFLMLTNNKRNRTMKYIFDIDGTLADCSQRLHFIQQEQPDWDAFYKDCVNDKPISPVVELAQVLKDSYQDLIFVTGRPEKYMEETTEWLCNQLETDYIVLFMRKNGDHRPDYIVKKEIYEEDIKPYHHIDGVFEDRKQCVDMWRSLGLTCYQVADGNY